MVSHKTFLIPVKVFKQFANQRFLSKLFDPSQTFDWYIYPGYCINSSCYVLHAIPSYDMNACEYVFAMCGCCTI